MSPYRAALLALFVVGGALVTAVPAGGTDAGGVEANPSALDAPATVATANATNNSSLGADISSFMQSSAAEVGGAVETGMWTAAFNATRNRSARAELVERRTAELRSELEELRQRKAELVAEREAGNVSETAYKAKVSRLLGQINAFESAINATSKRAMAVNGGVDAEALESLRGRTENLTGPEIAGVASNVTGVGNGPDVGGGGNAGNGRGAPPNDAGAGSDATTGPPNDDGTGGVDDTTTGVGERGPPSDRGSNGSGDDAPNATDPASRNPDRTPNAAAVSPTSSVLGATTTGGLVESVDTTLDAGSTAVDRALAASPA